MFEIIFQLKVTTSNNILVILQFSFLLPLSRTFRHPGEWEYAAPAYQLKCFHWGFLQFTRIIPKKVFLLYLFLWEEMLWKEPLLFITYSDQDEWGKYKDFLYTRIYKFTWLFTKPCYLVLTINTGQYSFRRLVPLGQKGKCRAPILTVPTGDTRERARALGI